MEHVLKEISFDLLYPRAAVSVDMGQGRDRLRGVTTYAGSTFYSIIIFNTIRKHQIKYPNFGQKKKKTFLKDCSASTTHHIQSFMTKSLSRILKKVYKNQKNIVTRLKTLSIILQWCRHG